MNQNPSHYPPQHQPTRPPLITPDHSPARYAPESSAQEKGSTVKQNEASNDEHTLVGDLRSLLSATTDILEENVSAARERLAGAINSGRTLFKDVENTGIEKAKATDKAVRQHPYQAAAIAFGIGLMIGHLATHKTAPGPRWLRV